MIIRQTADVNAYRQEIDSIAKNYPGFKKLREIDEGTSRSQRFEREENGTVRTICVSIDFENRLVERVEYEVKDSSALTVTSEMPTVNDPLYSGLYGAAPCGASPLSAFAPSPPPRREKKPRDTVRIISGIICSIIALAFGLIYYLSEPASYEWFRNRMMPDLPDLSFSVIMQRYVPFAVPFYGLAFLILRHRFGYSGKKAFAVAWGIGELLAEALCLTAVGLVLGFLSAMAGMVLGIMLLALFLPPLVYGFCISLAAAPVGCGLGQLIFLIVSGNSRKKDNVQLKKITVSAAPRRTFAEIIANKLDMFMVKRNIARIQKDLKKLRGR